MDYIRRNHGEAFDIVFLDPPYAAGLYRPALQALLQYKLLKPTSLIICESGESEIFDGDEALADCFAEYYLIPKITRVVLCEEKFGSIKWEVETDRGPVKFRIRSRHSDIKKMHGSNRIIVRDTNDNRYEIPDYTVLDPHSKRLLFSYL